ncbi:hydantoinase/oxoprolinase family protein [Methylobacterium organophilum]|uniref:hydantoinase/oxoprolinase family protein n=1 Tax=Methylobacterium organophilum TaxID=410 RepID=UPI001F13A785|nr:hydantoinase/oxoprolinase family protein [Methylobacterium organophilum]UMY16332.1 hydantoinase/oxoprolinase family protein [Methylobacterium organophilum]
MIRLATDVGGTFTDLIGYDEREGRLYTAKVLTTTDDQSRGVMHAIDRAGESQGLDPTEVRFFVHGGTTVINAITERKGVRTALLTTRGFRDVLAIGRGTRPDLYNLRSKTPDAFVPRHLRFEVRERLNAAGEIVEPLNEDDVRACAEACRAQGVETIGIVLLHSYANPAHEERCAQILRECLPGVPVCASHEISRQWREYERSNTVALNAYVQPIVQRYFANLERSLAKGSLEGPYYAMQSNGGIARFDQAARAPLTLIESGPAGGVAGAARIAQVLAEPDLIYLDVGGTTAKCSVIRGGQPSLAPDYKLEKTRTSPGYTVQVPVVDIVEVGAGGGSIAWLDAGNRLRVGPHSAGSNPGPACYGLGGTRPTVTDAKLVTGVIDPVTFGEGRIALDLEAARRAVATIAEPLGMSVEEAASALIEVAEETMISALKLISIQRGHDPRDFALLVSGGAGPLLAAKLAREMSVRACIIPTQPGIFSAWGMLAARPRIDLRRMILAGIDDELTERLPVLFAELAKEAAAYFGVDDAKALVLTPIVEGRYRNQEHSVAFDCPPDASPAEVLERFHAAHRKAFTFDLPGVAAELTTIHLQAEAPVETVPVPRSDDRSHTPPVPDRHRPLYLDGQGWADSPVYRREGLRPGQTVSGPALVEEATTTTLVLPGQTCAMDPTGQMIIREDIAC